MFTYLVDGIVYQSPTRIKNARAHFRALRKQAVVANTEAEAVPGDTMPAVVASAAPAPEPGDTTQARLFDDLTDLFLLGDKAKEALNEHLGIYTFAQLAAANADDIEPLVRASRKTIEAWIADAKINAEADEEWRANNS